MMAYPIVVGKRRKRLLSFIFLSFFYFFLLSLAQPQRTSSLLPFLILFSFFSFFFPPLIHFPSPFPWPSLDLFYDTLSDLLCDNFSHDLLLSTSLSSFFFSPVFLSYSLFLPNQLLTMRLLLTMRTKRNLIQIPMQSTLQMLNYKIS